MTLAMFWLGIAASVSIDHAVRLWTQETDYWIAHSVGAVGGAFVVAWGVWLVVGRFGGSRTAFERRHYLLTLAMLVLAVSWFARHYAH